MKVKPNVSNLIYKRSDNILVTNTDLLADELGLSPAELGQMVREQTQFQEVFGHIATYDFAHLGPVCMELTMKGFQVCFLSRSQGRSWKNVYQKIIDEFDKDLRRRRASGETVTLTIG